MRCSAGSLPTLVFQFLVAAVIGVLAAETVAQSILYSRPGAGGDSEIWRVNPDGSGNQPVNINLPNPDRPIWSKGGSKYLVTSSDPGSPQLSQNVYEIDASTNQATRVSNYSDTQRVNPQTQQLESTVSLPLFKAYAGNDTAFATSNIFRTIVGTDSTVVPLLEKFDGPGAQPVQLNFGAIFDGFTGQGLGVDWAPQGDLVLTPIAVTAPDLSSTTTAIGVFSPVGNGTFLGQLTNPQASSVFGQITWQNDYQPAFSPDGNQIAYFRATTIFFTNGGFAPSQVDLRVVNRDGTNDRLLFDFNAGTWPNQVTWSPDGTQLVFDFGPQVFEGGVPTFGNNVSESALAFVDITATQSGTIPTNGPAAFPAWQPAAVVNPNTPGDFNSDGRVDNGDLNLLLSGWGDSSPPSQWTGPFTTPIDNDELNALLGNWGFGSTAVPEPAAAMLLGIAVVGAGVRWRG